MAATVTPPGISGVQGALTVFRGNTVSTLVLPPVVDRSQARGGTSFPTVQILPGGRVLYGNTAVHIGSGFATGMSLALGAHRPHAGRRPVGSRLRRRWRASAGVQPDTPNCASKCRVNGWRA